MLIEDLRGMFTIAMGGERIINRKISKEVLVSYIQVSDGPNRTEALVYESRTGRRCFGSRTDYMQ